MKILFINHNYLILWSQWWESNSRPTDYESVALPTELHRQVLLNDIKRASDDICYHECYHETYKPAYLLFTTDFLLPNSLIQLVGTIGFEPATPCPPDKCATKLRYAPKLKYFFKTKGLCTQPSNNKGITYYSKQLHMMILFK